MENKNILHINTQLRSRSGTIPYRIHEGFIENGWNSTFLTAYCDNVSNYQNVVEIPNQHLTIATARLLRKLWYGKIRGKDDYYFFPQISMRTASFNKMMKLIKEPPSIIVAYWTNFFFTQKLIHDISQYFHAPVILYLMDEEPYTGGCHMTFSCQGYLSGCGNCKALKMRHARDISYRSVRQKKKWIEMTDIKVIAQSTFMLRRLNQSFIFEKVQKDLLLLPINEKIYRPEDKKVVREELGLPENKKIILFGGASFERVNKGMIYLIQALKHLSENSKLAKDIHVVWIGNGEVKESIPFDFTCLGYLNTSEKMAQAYQICDAFVCPTIQDAGPTMINEAMMCGRPVVSFDMGVARDLIIDGETGYIAKVKDAKDLAFCIQCILESKEDEWENISRRCRNIALEKCSMSRQIERLVGLVKNNE